LFSATQTKEVSELVKAGLRNPVKVSIKVEDKRENKIQAIPSTYGFWYHSPLVTQVLERLTPPPVVFDIPYIFFSLGNFYMTIPANEKLNQLVAFIAKHKEKKIIVYFLTCACVNFFWWVMRELEPLKDHPIFSLHGQVPPKKRSGTPSDIDILIILW
jgi:ATP-dependent RNA helicase DDX55/SPB4